MLLLLIVLLVIVVLIYNVGINRKFTALQQQMQKLQRQLDDLRNPSAAIPTPSLPDGPPHHSTTPATPARVIFTHKATRSTAIAHSESSPTHVTASAELSQVAAATDTQSEVTSVQITASHTTKTVSLFSPLWHWFIRDNPLAKLAIIILFLGLSYLLKYSLDHHLLAPEIRILGSLVISVGLFVTGWSLRKKRGGYALIIQGGGIGALYVTLVAAFKLYALIPMPVTLLLLVIVCTTSVIFAVLQHALSLAILASLGGYLAPVLLSTGTGNYLALFSYYLLISAAILAISVKQSWRVLNLLGFTFTVVIALTWGIKAYEPAYYGPCQLFLIANLLIYGVLAVSLSVRREEQAPYQSMMDLLLLFAAPLIGFSLQYAMTRQWPFAPAFSALFFGLFYLVGAYAVLNRWGVYGRRIASYGLAIGLGFISLAIPLALSVYHTALVWLVEGTMLTLAALHQKQVYVARLTQSVTLLGCAAGFYSLTAAPVPTSDFILLYGISSAGLLANACCWYRARLMAPFAQTLAYTYLVLAALSSLIWVVGGVSLTAGGLFVGEKITLWLNAAVWIWYLIGQRLPWPHLRYAVIALWITPLTTLLSMYEAQYVTGSGLFSLWYFAPIASFISGYLFLSLSPPRPEWKQPVSVMPTLHLLLFWQALLYGFMLTNYPLIRLAWGYDVLRPCGHLIYLSVVLLSCYVAQRRGRFPFRLYPQHYWLIGLAPVALALVINLLTALPHPGLLPNVTYMPLINPLEESALFAIMLLALWLHQTRQWPIIQSQGKPLHYLQLALISGLLFLWGNSLILRTLSHGLSIPWSFIALWDTHLVQLIFSLSWMITALLLVVSANRAQSRTIWFCGVILQGIVVSKLVLIDSSALAGLYRAFTFIGVALLMLIIGYLAPLPPKRITPNLSVNHNTLDEGTHGHVD